MIPSTTAETILVVDDRASLCELIEIILTRAGYRVLTATNGHDALHRASESLEVDLLVTDLEMPGMRGDELATRFIRFHPSARIIFLSTTPGPIETPEPFEFLAKPFTVTELRDTVRRALRARPATKEVAAQAA